MTSKSTVNEKVPPSRIKLGVYQVLNGKRRERKIDAYIHIFISSLIVCNVVAVFLESYEHMGERYATYFQYFEIFSILIFTVEYILRVWTADLLYPELGKTRARLRFISSFYGLIDVLAILPFFLPLLITMDLRIVRALRLLRLLRFFKLTRYSKSLRMMGEILKETRHDLMVTVFATIILLVVASTLMFNIEHDAQPDAFENIGQALWWAIATLTTVGYGDIYPITGWGKFLGGVIALLGIGIVALPTGIISSAFVDKIQDNTKKKMGKKSAVKCPNCGEPLA